MRRRIRRAELRKSLAIELEGLRLKLASSIFNLAVNNRTVGRELLQFIEPIMRSDKAFPETKGAADVISNLLKLTDEQIVRHMSERKTGGPLNLKKYTLPLLTSQLSSLSLFSAEFQRMALKICSRLAIINDEIDMAIFHYKKTFDSLSPQDHAIVVENSRQSHQFLAILSRPLIDDINLLLSIKK